MGRQPLPGFQAVKEPSGIWSGLNAAGVPVHSAYRRSPLSGWIVGVGIGQQTLEAPLWDSFIWLFCVGTLVLFCAGVSSALLARLILRSQATLADAAARLEFQEIVVAPVTEVKEANVIGNAIADASSRLAEKTRTLKLLNAELERSISERTADLMQQTSMLRITLENMDQGLMFVNAEGDDEFAIVISDADEALTLAIGQQVVQELARPYLLDGKRFVIGCSMGIVFSPRHGRDAPTLHKRADLALYKAKRSGKGAAREFEFAFESAA